MFSALNDASCFIFPVVEPFAGERKWYLMIMGCAAVSQCADIKDGHWECTIARINDSLRLVLSMQPSAVFINAMQCLSMQAGKHGS